MNRADHVTEFAIENKTIVEIIKGLNAHLEQHIQREERDWETFCCSAAWENPNAVLPERYRWLIAFSVEGESEAWYVHVGAIVQRSILSAANAYIDMGFTKVWSVEASFAVQKEAQRFLTAARWN
ncbi:MAG TPA: hypothetical protein VFW94_23610 [Candidatus Acidoferrales bacterium]|nr:hypothetical protein [Candidatus Acidoferrales bacterium]